MRIGFGARKPVLSADGDVIKAGLVELMFRMIHAEVPTDSV